MSDLAPEIDRSKPHPARLYDFFLGGENNFAADREAAAEVLKHSPSAPEGRTAYIQADVRDPAAILSDPVTTEMLDFRQPIGLILAAILHFVRDEDNPRQIIATLLDALPGYRCRNGIPMRSRSSRSLASSWCPPASCSCRNGGRTAPARPRPRPR